MRHLSPGLIYFSVLSCLLRGMFCARLPSMTDSAVFKAEHLEAIMFPDQVDAARYRRMCGSNWHRLFQAWETQQKLALSGDNAIQLVIWRCPQACGGLGDRQRGILTSFTLALVLGRAFFIDSETPVPFRHFFRPANPELHWIYDNTFIEGRTVIEELFSNEAPPIGDYASANLSYYDRYDVVIQENNYWQPFSILRNAAIRHVTPLSLHEDHILAGCILNYLLVPNLNIQTHIQRILQEVQARTQSLIAVQMRTGDSRSKNLTMLDDLYRIFHSCVERIRHQTEGNYSVFVTSDSEYVMGKFAADEPGLISFAGKISHPDGQFGIPDDPDAAFRKLILDHIMLSHAQQLLVSRSGFAELAAVRGFKSYYTPLHCHADSIVPHYVFPLANPLAVPGYTLNTVAEIFRFD